MTSSPIAIDGTYNFRDLGGFRADGGRTVEGGIFRSDALAALSDLGREQFAGLGVARVIDLRDPVESTPLPDLVPDEVSVVAHPIFPDVTKHMGGPRDVFAFTEMLYLTYGGTLSAAVAMLADPEPTVFHCTAGKDRTGAVAALALLAVGVDRDDVMHDYSLSEQNLSGEWSAKNLEMVRGLGVTITPAVEALLVTTPIGAIDGALTAVETRYGSTRDYLRAHGVGDDVVERLHARFVA